MNITESKSLNLHHMSNDFGIKALILLSSFIAVFCSANLQAGEDGKIYSGNMCKPTASQDGGYAPYVHYNTDGSVSNTSEQFSVTVTCPIIRDHMSNNDGLTSVVAYYDDRNPYYNFFCNVQSRWKQDNRVLKTANTSFHKTYGLSYLYTHKIDISRGANTFYTMTCVLPRKYPGRAASRLLNYKIVEGGDTWNGI